MTTNCDDDVDRDDNLETRWRPAGEEAPWRSALEDLFFSFFFSVFLLPFYFFLNFYFYLDFFFVCSRLIFFGFGEFEGGILTTSNERVIATTHPSYPQKKKIIKSTLILSTNQK